MQKNVSDGLPLPQRYGAIATIVIGISMAVLDGAIANVALPTIAKDLNASPASSIWIVNAYQIAIVISLLSLSFLGDMFGYRRVYQCGLVVFTLTSLFCALSDSLHTLTLARIAQGFGGAALMSVNTALIRLIYPQRHLGRGMGINSFIVAVSSAAAQRLPPPSCPLPRGSGCLPLTCRWALWRSSSPCAIFRKMVRKVPCHVSICPAP